MNLTQAQSDAFLADFKRLNDLWQAEAHHFQPLIDMISPMFPAEVRREIGVELKRCTQAIHGIIKRQAEKVSAQFPADPTEESAYSDEEWAEIQRWTKASVKPESEAIS